MNNVDKQYLALMQDIIKNGVEKETRSGKVLSVFGRSMRFNLNEGLPLLTTKKVYHKGVIHELLWFLKGDTNIKYLTDNNVHIWDDDAFRWFKSQDFETDKENLLGEAYNFEVVNPNDEDGLSPITQRYLGLYQQHPNSLRDALNKEQFLELVSKGCYITKYINAFDRNACDNITYTFGNLGPIYGKQWRSFGFTDKDQINTLIDTLKSNPNDRRMVITGWNPDVFGEIALPACHMFSQFWSRELSNKERISLWFVKQNLNNEIFENHKPNNGDHSKEYCLYKEYTCKNITEQDFIDYIDRTDNIPKHELSLSFYCRSQDVPLGTPYNIASYAVLCHIIANICNMTVGDLIYNAGDVHIYENQLEGCREQLTRNGYNELPELIIKRQLTDIDDIKYDDFEIINYKSNPAIKFPLSVG